MDAEITDTDLDEETRRLLEECLREPITSFASECHGAIRAEACVWACEWRYT